MKKERQHITKMNYELSGKTNDEIIVYLLELAKTFLQSDPEETLELLEKAIEVCHKANARMNLAECLSLKGEAKLLKQRFKDAADAFYEAIQIYKIEAIDDFTFPQLINAHYKFALMNIHLGIYSLALEYFVKGLEISEAHQDSKMVAEGYMFVGNTLVQMQNYDKAETYILKALDLFHKLGDKVKSKFTSVNLGLNYVHKKEHEKAIFIFLKTIDYFIHDEKRQQTLSSLYHNLGFAYEMKEEWENAIAFYHKALEIRLTKKDTYGLASTYLGLGSVYRKMNQLETALTHLELSLEHLRKVKYKECEKSVYVELYKIYLEKKDAQNALDFYVKYSEINEALFKEGNIHKILEFEATQEIEKKEREAEIFRLKNVELARLNEEILIQKTAIEQEKLRNEELLLNILPEEIAEELKLKGFVEAKMFEQATVLFTDFVGFTQMSQKMTPKEILAELNECFSAFDYIMQKHGVEKIKTIGDAYMAVGGVPTPSKSHALDVVNAALDIQAFMVQHKIIKEAKNETYFEIRIGVHTGALVAGVVGVKKFAYDIWGDTVNTAARLESSGTHGEVNVSESTYALIKDHFECVYRGKIQAKGKGQIDMYFIKERKNN